ncbi:MAG TPA: 1-acyl-sn-glycerol-3-phosphate acyltransferase, partial [bacterium]|nr:1-acyl-sn-glycerol-3-phosphate acyltransferase [bacterium]
MARLIPARVHVDGDPANLLPGRRHLIHRMARKTEILPHAQRRFQGINRNVITVFTAPVLTPWLAQLLNHRMRIELWQASAYLLTAAPRSSTSQDPLRPLTQEHSFYLNLDFRRPGAQDSLHAWIQWLLELGASHQRAVHFIPVLYLLNRSPKHRWYHTPLTWTLLPGESLISTGLPLYVFPGVTLEPPRPDVIRRHQLREWSRERRVIVGDRKVRMRRMIEVIQEEPLLKRQLEVIATQGKDTMATLLTRVSAYVREISADFSPNAPRVWDRVITPFLRKNFSSLEFDQDGLDELRHLLRRKKRVLLVPSHRSHLDYILISYAIHKQGLSCPLVAAGKNLAFWPMGYFFRKTGAFFIRRTFKGLDIYPHVFRAYLWHIMHKFQPVEFFIEGGRSRTGALLPAKLGMLNMVLEAIRSGHFDDIIVVPMAVNYDRIPEEQSYIRELRGKAKQKERITGLLKNRHLLKRRFGKVHMATGQPLHIAPLLRDEASNIVQKDIIGGTIMDRIRKTMPVTACSLLAATAMARPPEQRTARVELIADAQLFLEIITRCFPSAHIAGECRRQSTRRNAWQEAFHRMTDFGNFISEHGDDTWRVNPRRRFQVDYLRNSLMGLLLPPALAAGYPESPEETSGFPALSQLMCPEIHPIPADILGMEIDHCRTVIPHLSRQQTELLECLLAPATALRCALSNALGHAGMSIDSISVTEWNRLFDSIAQ